jgi:hypothetical protein
MHLDVETQSVLKNNHSLRDVNEQVGVPTHADTLYSQIRVQSTPSLAQQLPLKFD